jgi:hypothetical protein
VSRIVGVFHALSNAMWIDWYEVVVWTYLATIATIAMFQPPPTHRRVAGVAAVVVLLASQALTTGVTPITSVRAWSSTSRRSLSGCSTAAPTR